MTYETRASVMDLEFTKRGPVVTPSTIQQLM